MGEENLTTLQEMADQVQVVTVLQIQQVETARLIKDSMADQVVEMVVTYTFLQVAEVRAQ